MPKGSLLVRKMLLWAMHMDAEALDDWSPSLADTANWRDLKVYTPADWIVSNTVADNEHALWQIQTAVRGSLPGPGGSARPTIPQRMMITTV